ncbi:MAG: hypothetical protein NTV51_00305 [Verrucomicrobia bacterium]|nr:hypothetical protein [Verrucomicrobiota bacterium]
MISELQAEMDALNSEYDTLTVGRPKFPGIGVGALALWERQKSEWENDHRAADSAPRRMAIRFRLMSLETAIMDAVRTEAYAAQSLSRLAHAGVPKNVIEELGKLKPTKALDAARAWWKTGGWALLLLGDVGNGKSTAAGWVAQQAAMAGSGQDWVVWCRAASSSREALFGDDAVRFTRHARHCSLLVLNDLGAEMVTDAWRAWLEDVIDFRWSNRARTVIDSNLSADAFKAKMGARVTDRLRDGGKVVGAGTVSMRGQVSP